MAIPSNTGIKVLGTEVVMESSGDAISNGGFFTCNENDFLTANVEGLPFAQFEWENAGSFFTAAPTAGAIINVYEMPFDSNGNQGPQIDSTYKKNYVGCFHPDEADAQQYLSFEGPINFYGGDYVLEWIDGGAGTAGIEATWILRVIPYGIGAST